jgi:hypothetical protein
MPAGPQNTRAPPFKAGQHDPEIIARTQFHEALQAKAGDRQIRDVAAEPGFAGTTYLNADLDSASFGSAAFAILFELRVSAHDQSFAGH